jgi:hypothetical protein
MQLKDLMKIYGMSGRMITKHLFPVIGRIPEREQHRLLAVLIRKDPEFGKHGERAPGPHSILADKYDVPLRRISDLRQKAGVLPFSESYDKNSPKWGTMTPKHQRRAAGCYRLTRREEAAYELCKIALSWGRPEGLNELLTEIKRRKELHSEAA